MKQKLNLDDAARVAGHLTIRKYRGDELISQTHPLPNKVVSTSGYGRNLLARALAGDATYPPQITSAALGDDNTAAADTDTGLGDSLVSAISLTNVVVSNDSIQVDVFVADADLPDGTYQEFGLFCGTQLFARIIIDPSYVKASGEDTLFSYSLTLTG